MIDIKQISAQLASYGLSENESKIYLFLLRQAGELSVVQIARTLKLGRTPVYNALDKLESKGLVSRAIADSGSNYMAASPDHLGQYWRKKIHGAQRLGSKLPDLVNVLEGLTVTSGYKSKVDYFTGRRGLEQITYNSLRADGDLYIYEVATDMTVFTSQDTAEGFRQVLVERGVTTHQLTNHTSFEDYTAVEKMITDLWDVRYIDPALLKIQFEMLIYNDTCALYSVEGHDAFGVEIHNANLAQMQKQIFKAMQRLAKPLVKDDIRGAAHVDA
ncbi:MAG: helix-turn-helix domain-containing protein [Candidatus Nomurabacteria bacterium]|jgi:predicted DNA-binding transcriptional regulator|nr:helix-turn-helix domain-containing protein [Candidatus Nomurabacteria bacterium]